MSKYISKFTIILIFASGLTLFAQTPQTSDNKVSNHEAVCDGALELIPSTMKFERKRYVSKIPARTVKPKKRK